MKKILIVDDEEFNLDILDEYLKDSGYDTILARNGIEALSSLENCMPVDAIVLDRMMPVMDGMRFLKEIKSKSLYRDIPVIMQTAAGSREQIMEGISAGVFYYLTKPYEGSTLIAILNSALEQHHTQHHFTDESHAHRNAMMLLEQGRFRFRTLEEARQVAFAVSNIFKDPEKVVFGLNELTINAVEHGNLNISYEDKKLLLQDNSWHKEIDRRLALPENSSKYATLVITAHSGYHEIRIKDMGKGFDFKKFLAFDHARMIEPSGRGIAMSRIYSFDELEFIGSGNEVVCRINKK
jgi:CheY-like chemotaxis protein